jgi:hypothetical protein
MADVTHLTWDPGSDWETGDWDPDALFRDCVREATADELPEPRTGRPVPDTEDLSRGDPYIGPREGYRFSVDSNGRPFEKGAEGRKFIQHEIAEEMTEYVHRRKGGGTVLVNDANHAIMITEGEAIFLGVIDPNEFEYVEDETSSVIDEIGDETLDEFISGS